MNPEGASGERIYRVVSGDIPHDPADNVKYVIVTSSDKRVVNTFSLPGHANIPKFRILVTVPTAAENYEAGRLDEGGKFIPYDFTVSETSLNVRGEGDDA